MPGTIKLLLPNGTKEKEVHYYSTKEWKSIIEGWILLYGQRIENYDIQIRPSIEKVVNHMNFKIKQQCD